MPWWGGFLLGTLFGVAITLLWLDWHDRRTEG